MFPPIAANLRDFFRSRGVTAYLVGGCLRDALAGATTHDLDLAVAGDAPALARELAARLGGSFVPLDAARGIARVVVGGLTVDLASMRGSLHDDLGRRDFTIDAMALPLAACLSDAWQDEIIDPFGGRDDLSRGVARMVSPGAFRADPGRLLRGVRLAKSHGLRIHPETRRAMTDSAPLLNTVSKERARDEFLRLLSLKGAKETLHSLDGLGLLCHIIPELEHARGVEQPKEHYWDVFEHTIQTVGAAELVTDGDIRDDPLLAGLRWDADTDAHFSEPVSDGHTRRTMLKLGALFHDIAKPQTKSVDDTGRTRFLGHPQLGAEVAESRLRTLRLSSRGVKSVASMVEYHLRPTQMSQDMETPSPRAVTRFYRSLGETATSVLYLSLADYRAAKGPMLEQEGWQQRVELVNYVLRQGREGPGALAAAAKPRPLLTGHDLIDSFGLEPGPVFRWLLDGLEEARAAGEAATREDALRWVAARLEESKQKDKREGSEG